MELQLFQNLERLPQVGSPWSSLLSISETGRQNSKNDIFRIIQM
ncbi:unnamed protein product [Larinioides sclopetarius]|uniref:Uncharacterized protein n=1 Tax=Larinioides sclopetarius TaxID=280406 RepID=A0AAV1ZH45_9ARAC